MERKGKGLGLLGDVFVCSVTINMMGFTISAALIVEFKKLFNSCSCTKESRTSYKKYALAHMSNY